MNLTDSLKTQLGKIKDIKKEDTTELDYIYPVEVDGTNAVANALPIQAITNTQVHVSLALPLTAGKGRSIRIDLTEATKTKISKIRDIKLEQTNAPLSSLYPSFMSRILLIFVLVASDRSIWIDLPFPAVSGHLYECV